MKGSSEIVQYLVYFLENQSYTCTRLNHFESWIHVITKQVNNHYDITSRSQATDESWFAKTAFGYPSAVFETNCLGEEHFTR